MEKRHWLSLNTLEKKMDALRGLLILAVLILTTLSFLRLCSQACSEGHNYFLLGMSFETMGFIFFGILGILHLYRKRTPIVRNLEFLAFSSALGAEMVFIGVQKYLIGTWCPVCLTIASCVLIGVISCAVTEIHKNQGENIMVFLKSGLTNLTALAVGFFVAFMGISKHDAMQAAEQSVQERLAFGNTGSPIEAYLFTDWLCPACKKIEPRVEELERIISPQAQLTFVDEAIHPESLNFTPFNISFLLNNKSQYFKLRQMLTAISLRTKTPTEAQIEQEAAKIGVKFVDAHYSDISLAVEYYKKLIDRFKVDSTPTLIIINSQTKKGKKLEGDTEITKENVIKAIEALKSTSIATG